ncbi:MAG: hypothetical protein U9O64_04475 [Campylobacterota bacterium]|nr:hypothetical protein [Campylobacterota bacterium]
MLDRVKSISKYGSFLFVGAMPVNALELGQVTQKLDVFLPYTIIFILMIAIFLIIQRDAKIIKEKELRIAEHEEKIKWFRQVSAENEHKKTTKEHEVEKEILELNHIIENLEQKVKEGEKNQIVSKIEMYEERRSKLFERAGIVL